jgi:hypothetical protein
MDCLTTERVRRVRLVPFIDPHYMTIPADFCIVYQRRYLDAETAHGALYCKVLASEIVVFVSRGKVPVPRFSWTINNYRPLEFLNASG